MKLASSLIALILLFLIKPVFAAPCCGGGQGSASVITGDEWLRFRYSQSLVSAKGRTANFGEATFSDSRLVSHGGNVSAAYAYGERWQAALATGWAMRSEAGVGLKDTTLSATYVLHRNYLYSPWLPEIFLSLGLGLPTGTSFYENRVGATDDGLFKSKASVLFSKTNMGWDWSLGLNYARSQAKRFQESELRFAKGDFFSSELSAGYTPTFASDWHVMLGWSFEYQSPNVITRDSQAPQTALAGYVFPVTLSVAYAFDDTTAMSMSYVNTRIISSQNSELSDAFALSLTHRAL